MTVIGLYPQVDLWIKRGSEWQGSYAVTQGDEVTYSAYVNALINGRPRKNDPFSGRDALPGQPLYESIHSIQFLPAYTLALFARAFGFTASTAFILLLAFSALSSSLAIFWLLAVLIGDSKAAAAGVLLTLCFGALVGSECCWKANAFTEMLPFLRRYQPATSFPLFFVFCVFTWRCITDENSRVRVIFSLAAGTLLSVMVLSYFFIWTAAAAWLACVGILWIVFRRDQLKRIALTIAVVGTFGCLGVTAFLTMLRGQHPDVARGDLPVATRVPDLLNQPQLIALVLLVVLIRGVWRKQVDLRSPVVLFTLSFILLPFVLFNQQVLTGTSVQPIHYKVFIANYVVLISVVLVFLILWRARNPKRRIPSLALALTAAVALGWGLFEVSNAAQRGTQKTMRRDDMFAVAKHLSTIANENGYPQAELPTVFTLSVDDALEVSQVIPTASSMAVLWSLHTDAFITPAESKVRFYHHLYYSGLTPKMLDARMRKNEFWVNVPLFGSERVVRGLVPEFHPVTLADIEEERRRYENFYNNFTRKQALEPTLNFVVIPDGLSLPNFANLDRWYERDSGQKVGAFTIHRVRLRT